MSRSCSDMLAFLCNFLVIFFAFYLFGYVAFGSQMEEFSTPLNSFMTMVCALSASLSLFFLIHSPLSLSLCRFLPSPCLPCVTLCLRLLLQVLFVFADIDFHELRQANAQMAGLFFSTFMLLVYVRLSSSAWFLLSSFFSLSLCLP